MNIHDGCWRMSRTLADGYDRTGFCHYTFIPSNNYQIPCYTYELCTCITQGLLVVQGGLYAKGICSKVNVYLSGDVKIKRAWEHWKKRGEPKLLFTLACLLIRKTYCSEEFTSRKEERPLFIQFCVNGPDTLLEPARWVELYWGYVDINLGCPTHVAGQENCGSFLMYKLPLVIEKLAHNLSVFVSCII